MDDSRKDRDARVPVNGAGPRRAKVMADPISAGLRALWANVENEPVPDEFLALLDRIDSAQAAGKQPDSGSGT